MSRFACLTAFEAALADLPMPDANAITAARARQARLTKPAGWLGRLEDIAVFLAGWQGNSRPVIDRGHAAIFAGNHGFVVHGVNAFPASVTVAMVGNFAAGGAATAIWRLSRGLRAD